MLASRAKAESNCGRKRIKTMISGRMPALMAHSDHSCESTSKSRWTKRLRNGVGMRVVCARSDSRLPAAMMIQPSGSVYSGSLFGVFPAMCPGNSSGSHDTRGTLCYSSRPRYLRLGLPQVEGTAKGKKPRSFRPVSFHSDISNNDCSLVQSRVAAPKTSNASSLSADSPG